MNTKTKKELYRPKSLLQDLETSMEDKSRFFRSAIKDNKIDILSKLPGNPLSLNLEAIEIKKGDKSLAISASCMLDGLYLQGTNKLAEETISAMSIHES